MFFHKPKVSFWDLYALLYDTVRNLLPYQELLRIAVQGLRLSSAPEKEMRILDAGCGTGNLADAILSSERRSLRVHGLDIAEPMLSRARRRLERYAAQVLLVRANLSGPLPYQKGAFDRIACLNALYAVRDPRATLVEFHRILKFGGLLVLANPRVDPKVRNLFIAHLRLVASLGFAGGFVAAFRTLLSLPPLLAISVVNLVVVKRRAKRATYHFLDAETLTNLLRESGFRILELGEAYGGTDVFAVATKVFPFRDYQGKPLTIEVAYREEDLADLFRLRYNVYCEEWRMLDPSDYPDRQERDLYDLHSIHIMARRGDEAVGTLRLIKDSPLGFLMEESFSLPPDIDRSRALEHSRAIVRKEDRRRNVHIGLEEAAYQWQRENGYPICIGAAVNIVRDSLLKRGWRPFGERKSYHGVTATPIIFRLDEQ